MFELYSDFKTQGTSYEEFCELLEYIDSITEVMPINTKNISIGSIIDETSVSDIALSSTGSFTGTCKKFLDRISDIKNEGKFPVAVFKHESPLTIYKLSKDKLKDYGWHPSLIREMVDTTKLCFLIKEGDGETQSCYPVTELAMNTLMVRAGLGGETMYKPSFRSASAIAYAFFYNKATAKPINLVIRSKESSKEGAIIGVHSSNYSYIPQQNLIPLISAIGTKMKDMKFINYEASNSITRCYVEFPEVGNDFKDAYGLPDVPVPGLFVYTSDSGEASFGATGTWRIGAHIVGRQIAKRVHKGKVSIEETIDNIDKVIFSDYKRVPERLCELLTIDILEPSETIKRVMNKCGFKKYIGAKLCKQLRKALEDELVPMYRYTAYDIALMISSVPDRCLNVCDSVKDGLRQAAGNALFCDYKDDDPIILT